MPKLIENKEKGFTLFLNKNRCGGCEICTIVCPTGILEKSDELNMRVAYIPRVKEGKEKYCTGCRRCELNCPDWCIYVIFDEKNNFNKEVIKSEG
ncbi:MAG: 4Fe-4S dicluster domain-containing protein [Promethearchaeota archaeon]